MEIKKICTFKATVREISDLAFSHIGLHGSALDTEKYPVFPEISSKQNAMFSQTSKLSSLG